MTQVGHYNGSATQTIHAHVGIYSVLLCPNKNQCSTANHIVTSGYQFEWT